jgi:serine/threonine-protein kinase
VIHRDIKPDNILLEEASGRALVADFGIAGMVGDSQALEEGEIVGTVEFMSPEQASGERVDYRSDLYSLGMVAFYALSGDLPFKSDSVTETLEHVRSKPVPAVATAVGAAPRRLTRIIDTCLRKDPDDRFESADQFAEALEMVSASRKQVPVAVRTFLYDPIDLGGDAPAYFMIASLASLPMFVAMSQIPSFAAVLGSYIAFVIGVPTVLVPPRVRRLIASGNTITDLELGMRQDLEQRKEESPQRPPSRYARIRTLLRKMSLAGLGGAWTLWWGSLLAAYLLGVSIPEEAWGAILLTIGGASGAGALLASIAPGSDEELRALKKAERRLKFWQGRMGRAIFNMSGVGLRKRITEVRATHRPTELQIGLAAEALFEALPKETRKEVGDIRATVTKLEADAHQLREYVNMLKEAESVGRASKVKFPADLRETREKAERQWSDVVAALETIRLELLRLTAGVGSIEGLTTHLLAAGQIRSNVGHMLEGMEEVEAVLELADSGGVPDES